MTKCPRCGGETTDRHKFYGRQGRGPKAGTIGAVRVHAETGMVGCERGERGRTTYGPPPSAQVVRSTSAQTKGKLPLSSPLDHVDHHSPPPLSILSRTLSRGGEGEMVVLVVHDGSVPHNDGPQSGTTKPDSGGPHVVHVVPGGPPTVTPGTPDSSNDLLTSYFDA